MARIPRIAQAQRTTCLTGPTGSGKEVVARTLHDASQRRGEPFVTVHCGAIPDELFESELFGHVRGAFTGAMRAREGLVGQARMGTLFLDEVNSLTPRAQSKLLRLLESGEYRAVGSDEPRRSRAWILSASNADLRVAVASGAFRSDLLYRLEAIRLELPSLAERGADVLLLAEHFKNEAGGAHLAYTAEARRAMMRYDWPGNVRELKHRVESAVLLHEGQAIDAEDLGIGPYGGRGSGGEAVLDETLWNLISIQGMTLAEAVEHCEQALIGAALRAEEGNRTRAAGRLGIHVRTIFKKLAP